MLKTVSVPLLGLVAFMALATIFGGIGMRFFRVWRDLSIIDHQSLYAALVVLCLGPLAEELARLTSTWAVLRRPVDYVRAWPTVAIGLGFGLVERAGNALLYSGQPVSILTWLYDVRAVMGHTGLSALLWLLWRRLGLPPLFAMAVCTVAHTATNFSTRLDLGSTANLLASLVFWLVAYSGLIALALWPRPDLSTKPTDPQDQSA